MIQLQVLNYLLDTKDVSFIIHNNLNDKFFSNYKEEFKFIKNHLDNYNTICDKETFLSKFSKFSIIEVHESPAYLIKALFDDYNAHKLAESFNTVKNLVMSGKTDEAMSVFKKANEQLSEGVALTCVDILKDTSRYNDYIERTKNVDKFYIKTGFRELDKIIGGFDREEELGVIVARTNYGKSWILMKCAVESAKQGLNVGVYSGEMSERKVGYRADTLIGHMNNGAIVHGNADYQNEYKKYIEDELPKVKGSLKVLTPKMINGPADVTALRAFIEKEKLDILYIDQLSLLEDQRHGKTSVDKASNISKDLKNLQVLKRIPIILVVQQNRTKNEDDEKIVDTTQIAMSDRIGQDATCIIAVIRDKKDPSIMKLQIVKSRDSENGAVLNYNIDLNKGEFNYIPDIDDANSGESEENYESRYSMPEGEEIF